MRGLNAMGNGGPTFIRDLGATLLGGHSRTGGALEQTLSKGH